MKRKADVNRILRTAFMPIALPFRARFTAGVSALDALSSADEIRARGATPLLNFLGEHFQRVEDVREQRAMYLALLPNLKAGDRIVVKPSQIGYDVPGYGMIRARECLFDLIQEAERSAVLIEIDMEDAARAQASVALALISNGPIYPPTRVALAARLKRSAEFAGTLSKFQVPVRLVKGAYEDASDVSSHDSREIRQRYKELTTLLLIQGTDPAFATHDEHLIEHVRSEALRLGVAKENFEFQFLKGFRPKMQRSLVREGYRVAVYIPFGPLWFEYGMRRWKFFRRNPQDLFRALFG